MKTYIRIYFFINHSGPNTEGTNYKQDRLRFLRIHQKHLKVEMYQGLPDCIADSDLKHRV